MFLMCLHILTEFHFAMSIEVQLAAQNKFRWALSLVLEVETVLRRILWEFCCE